MGNLNYIEGDKDAPGKSGGFRLVEVDKDGNCLMKLYDIENRMFFENCTYYFSDLSDKSKRAYTWHQQKSFDTAPVFPDDAVVKCEKCENEALLLFPEAEGYYEAENYKITIYNSEKKKVNEFTAISDYVRAKKDLVRVNIGNIPEGKYSVKIRAYSPYAKKGGKLTGSIFIK